MLILFFSIFKIIAFFSCSFGQICSSSYVLLVLVCMPAIVAVSAALGIFDLCELRPFWHLLMVIAYFSKRPSIVVN